MANRILQPDLIEVNSFNDPNTPFLTNGFTNDMNTAVINPKRITLIKATIPVSTVQLPDYGLVFYYHSLASATTVPTTGSLKAVRLFPRTYIAPTGLAYTPTLNRFITGGSDLVALLNTAASAGGDDGTRNPLWTAGDVVFTWNSITQQITFRGTDAARYYTNAGNLDPLIPAALVLYPITMANAVGGGTSLQPQVAGITLNHRLGYCFSGLTLNNQGTPGLAAYACLTNRTVVGGASATTNAVPVDNFPNLVYTGNIYMYTSIVMNSGNAGNNANNKNLLAVIPASDVPNFGFIQFHPNNNAVYATKLPETINRIDIQLMDDANQPYLIGDNAYISVLFGINYNKDAP
jgi:hypothetical protein